MNNQLKTVSEELKDNILKKLKILKNKFIIHNNLDKCKINKKKLSINDVVMICEQIEGFVDFIKNTTNIEHFIYDIPSNLEERFNDNVQELEALLNEIKSSHINIKKQQAQYNFVKKEKVVLQKTLKKLKDTEIREMEMVAEAFDKTMFSRWETIKQTKKIDVIEKFLYEIQSKQLALENLRILSSRRLSNLSSILNIKKPEEKFKINSNLPIVNDEESVSQSSLKFPQFFFPPRQIEINIQPENSLDIFQEN
ncbi:uncharacterized protein LOC122851473 [Aphidius gifuensis]|uniref:uncharacterized protein LOC122851473 n=1 Tax=Aphidius gifuensis TaxID=684658 RepID=UPI001CDD831F|nr:uncharacterized protein LOC122851473 [Aphidius gifuensis]